ncbi:hypothetical protein JYU34_003383 [Plutella xylostella]|uniref:Uncharacterized protein n=1 Tax=Plutella xylostella TaxID=51655 RepID=A0ABQ7QZW8_PLUXY|nr:hypothetical protein JYU34_003383 [Plutella xylostella]
MYRFVSWCMLLLSTSSVLGKELTDIERLSAKPKHCSYAYAFDMYGAHCAGLGLARIPSLRGGIEILDFSKNMLKNLHKDTFSSYTSIKFLYLSENYIRHIDEDALAALTDLRTLDLSTNAITKLPDSLFQLPSLQKLYLSGNALTYLDSHYTGISKPIAAPLELIDVSDCELREVPDLGTIQELKFLNVSHNPLVSLQTSVFARACNLAKVDITGAIDVIRLCSLRSTITWFDEKHVYFVLDDYSRLNTKEFANCPREEISAELNATHTECKSSYLQVQTMRSSQRSMLTILAGLAGFLVGFILLLYLTHRWNVSKTKSAEKKMKPTGDGDKQATANLLHNVA